MRQPNQNRQNCIGIDDYLVESYHDDKPRQSDEHDEMMEREMDEREASKKAAKRSTFITAFLIGVFVSASVALLILALVKVLQCV